MKGLIDMSATTVIKDILEAKGKSQIELAEEINVTRQNLSNKMNRDKFSSLELVEIADALEMNLILRDKNIDSIINDYKEYMKDNEISDEDIETTTSYVKPFVQFLLEKQEHIIDYPEDKKGKSKRNMTEEEKKAAQKKSEETKARNAKKQAESQDN
jgi:transcriptional regulator with XRE-family HTH domain